MTGCTGFSSEIGKNTIRRVESQTLENFNVTNEIDTRR